VKIYFEMFWVMEPCWVATNILQEHTTSSFRFLPWSWRQQYPLKQRYSPTRLQHGILTQHTIVWDVLYI